MSVSVKENNIYFHNYPFSTVSQLTVAVSLSLDRLLVVVQLVVGHTIERILGIGRLVDGRIVLVAALDDALRGSAHQDDMVVGAGNGGVLDAAGLVPGDALKDVRLGSGRDFVRTAIVFDLLRAIDVTKPIVTKCNIQKSC